MPFAPANPPDYSSYKYYLITQPAPYVTHVEINRPSKYNSFTEPMWHEFSHLFDTLSTDPSVRAIVLSGAGPHAFTTGLDVTAAASNMSSTMSSGGGDAARIATSIRRGALSFQRCISAAERCEKPVICVMHGFSYGLAIDIACCTDIRVCAADTKFAVKEVDIGMAADIGTLSRLPKLVGSFGWVKDVALSARVFGAEEAARQGFVQYVEEGKEGALKKALGLAGVLAEKSPIGVQGTKEILNHARDYTIEESLRYTAAWTGGAMQAGDVKTAMTAGIQKRKPTFEKL